jgi:L-ascorbate metabolism protein UlaG (beta-lactamase superfamily)
MTGDTVLHRPLRRIAKQLAIDVMLIHLGAVKFAQTGPLRYSMNSDDGRELIRLARPRVTVPVHYDGWSHFSEPDDQLRSGLAEMPHTTENTIKWLTPGKAQVL